MGRVYLRPRGDDWTMLGGTLGMALLLASSVFSPVHANAISDDVQWRHYLGDLERSHYSPLDQITPENVAHLEITWTYHSGGAAQIQCNPIVVDGLLYGISAERRVFALEADTGRMVWTFRAPGGEAAASVVRGVQYWSSGDDKRIMVTLGHHIYALEARTGAPVRTFGQDGTVDYKRHYDRDVRDLSVTSTSPGAIYRDTMILSMRVSEAHPAVPGDIMAFDVRTGERKWVFHTIPHPGEEGYDTWPPEAWKTGGAANCWAGMSLDEGRGLVYIPTGSAVFDFYGGDRHGDNLFANCVIALEAETGKKRWHYQVVRHDLWDRDLPAPPNLVTLNIEGQRRDTVVQITKSGHIFVLDRDTGAPLFPIEEILAPPSDVPGELAAVSQPLPTKPPPFSRQTMDEHDVSDRTPEIREALLTRWQRTHKGHPFMPPSLEGTLIFPGFDGGGEWGAAAVNPHSGMLYVNASQMPWILTLFETTPTVSGSRDTLGKRVYSQHCLHCHGVALQGDPLGAFPTLRGVQSKLTRDQMGQLVRSGKERMPSFQFLPPAELDAVLTYVRQYQPATAAASAEFFKNAPVGPRTFSFTGYERFVDKDGYPAITPPWGLLTAIDLNRGELVWEIPLGENPELTDERYRRAGTENYGGPIVTAGGLIFIAATKDAHLRAFDERTGRELWKGKLPAGGYATPATYSVHGRQYVVIAAGGGKMGTHAGDAYVAFALPREIRP